MAKIDLNSLYVEFPVFNVGARSLKKHFLRLATGGTIVQNANEHVIIKALNNINLTINHNERVGLIGHNGSGKSTLLRLLANIYEPTRGFVRIEGNVAPMLDFLTGMEAEFTGYENIYIRGALLGLSKEEIKAQIEEIVEFTGLGDYIHMPVRTYSSGMKMRLAFAVSTCIKPDILLIDEVFGAGDASFIDKARKKMVSLLDQSSIVVMASHSNELILEFCNKSLLLENGQVKFFGPTQEALDIYQGK